MDFRHHLTGRAVRSLLSAAAMLALATAAGAADWPQFMGPKGDGTSPEKGLARTFPADGPKVLWRVPLGPGFGPAAIRDGQVFVLDRANKQETLRCHDLATGKELWTFAYDAPGGFSIEGSRCTPAVGDKYVFTIGGTGLFYCVDRATHKEVWHKDLMAEYGDRVPNWGVAQSPLLYKDVVIAAPQSRDAGVVAYDLATGKERWRSAGVGRMAYAAPSLINIGGVDQVVIVTNDGATAVNASDGKTLWSYAHRCQIAVPNVTVLGGGKLMITGGYNAGTAFFQVSKEGDTWTTKTLATVDGIGGHCHIGLVTGGHIYMLCNTNERADGLVCFDMDGKITWQTRREPYLDKGGSLLTGDNLIYMMDGNTGELYIIEPSAEGFKSLAKAKVLDGRQIWAPLALSDGKLIVRSQSEMKCLDLK